MAAPVAAMSVLALRHERREALLHANHIHSFAPIVRFDERLANGNWPSIGSS